MSPYCEDRVHQVCEVFSGSGRRREGPVGVVHEHTRVAGADVSVDLSYVGCDLTRFKRREPFGSRVVIPDHRQPRLEVAIAERRVCLDHADVGLEPGLFAGERVEVTGGVEPELGHTYRVPSYRPCGPGRSGRTRSAGRTRRPCASRPSGRSSRPRDTRRAGGPRRPARARCPRPTGRSGRAGCPRPTGRSSRAGHTSRTRSAGGPGRAGSPAASRPTGRSSRASGPGGPSRTRRPCTSRPSGRTRRSCASSGTRRSGRP
jgi:hypothetical protein